VPLPPNPVVNSSHHLVAFESDEEEAQQYDLLPISHSPARNSQGNSAQPPGPRTTSSNIANPQLNSRNRYYESERSGEENPNEEEDPFERVEETESMPGDDLNNEDIALPVSNARLS